MFRIGYVGRGIFVRRRPGSRSFAWVSVCHRFVHLAIRIIESRFLSTLHFCLKSNLYRKAFPWALLSASNKLFLGYFWHKSLHSCRHTMTSKILYKDIIKAIKLYVNFHPDTFPLILSYENHCTISYQEVMAQQLTEILGDSLYIPKEDSLHGKLPSPLE